RRLHAGGGMPDAFRVLQADGESSWGILSHHFPVVRFHWMPRRFPLAAAADTRGAIVDDDDTAVPVRAAMGTRIRVPG
ncbi:MAG TPA: hypothetical protein VFE47_11920, partial [Tepidisphaeraceae bacterium]|nr:hypothetical protein [Tepidisphaeraceae bacterium]